MKKSLNKNATFSLLSLIASFFIITHIYSQDLKPTIAPRIDSIRILHGDTTHDYYQWMQNKNDNRLINQLYAENSYAERVMKSSSLLQKRLYEEQRAMIKEDFSSDSTLYKGYWYLNKYEKGKDYPVYMRRKDSSDETMHVFFDGNKMAEKYSYFSLSTFTLSPNQKLLAYGINNDGSDKGYVYIKSIDNDSLLDEEIPRVSDFLWINDSVFLYIVENEKTGHPDRLYRHTLGDSIKEDSLIWYEESKAYFISLGLTTSREYILISRSGMTESEVYFANISSNPYSKFRLFQKMIPNKNYSINHYKGDSSFYISTNYENENGCLMQSSIQKTGLENWTKLINLPDSQDYIGSFVYHNYLVYSYSYNGLNFIKIRNRETQKEKLIKGSGDNYVLGLSNGYGYDSLKFKYYYTNLIQPPITHLYNLQTETDSITKIDTTITKYNIEDYTTERLWASASDGNKIPIDIVYKKGIQRDSTNPLLLYAYASYGNNTYPSFNEQNLIYLHRGFIYAIAHPRGESFLGKQWHIDGRLMNKKNTYTDFIVCANMLIDSGYTSSNKLAIMGGSAGGMLMGAVVTMRPDLCKCAILNVPFVDVLYEMQDTAWNNIIYHFKEIGNPFIKSEYDYIKSWCPYQNIKDTLYPDILVTSGYNDSRVPVWSPSKWVSKLRYHKKDTNLLLFRTNLDAGHGGQAGRYKYLKESSFQLAFIMRSLGIKEEYLTISGKVVDGNGEPLPFVNIFIEGTSFGTTTNFDGEFSLDIQKDISQAIIFQYVGFKKKKLKIDLTSRTSDLIVKLETELTLLPVTIITPDGRDPAYGIIAHAQKARKKHLNQLKAYSVDVYIKGVSRLNETPEKLPNFMKNWELPDSNDLGLLSLSESVTKYFYQAPDNYKEQMIASKVAGTSRGYSWNRSSDVMLNFYNNNIPMGWFGERGFISPIANTALMYYKYKLVGTKTDNKNTIYKIKVIPRRKHDPVFKGYIYIVGENWSIYTIDLVLSKGANLKLIDSLEIKQTHIPLNDSIWMPFTIQLKQNFKIFGFGGYDNSIGTFTNYNIHPNYKKNFFGNEVFRIEEKANKQDSVYWDKSRYIILTSEEKKYYHTQDSILLRLQSPEYLDSLKKARNKFEFGDFLWKPFEYKNYPKYYSWRVNSILSSTYYNTVEGLVVGINGGISFFDKKDENSNLWFWNGKFKIFSHLKYSVTNNEVYGTAMYYNKHYSIKAGRDMVNYSRISNTTNNIYTLFLKENYSKIYKKDFVKISSWKRIYKGLTANVSVSYERRYPMQNNAFFSFYDYFKQPEKEFISNNPLNPFDDALSFETYDILLADINFTIRFKQKYAVYPKRGKVYYNSKYPVVFINYKHGFYLSDSRSGFDYAQIAVSDLIDMKLLGKSIYTVNIGGILSGKDQIEFIDYKHFKGNQTIFLQPIWGVQAAVPFNTLNYFDYSTNEYYISGRWEHHFNGWVFNKLPIIRNLKFQVLAGTAALYTTDNGLFSELFIGAENIFNIFRVDFVTNYQNEKINPLIRIGVDVQL